ncbi:MAG: OstA-like protein [Flavobacteriaceae bacterium]|nr:OstA-like protein [Flavobacteriaceae bacterium]
MKINFSISTILLFTLSICSQESTKIQIDSAGFFEKNDVKISNATILTRDNKNRVKISHDGVYLWCNQAYFYENKNYIEAFGDVRMLQGDTLNLTSNYLEYNGDNKQAYAKGNVELIEPNSELYTESLYFDRNKQEVFYNNNGKVIKHPEDTIYSQIGTYYLDLKKYSFKNNVVLNNPKYKILTKKLDFYTDLGYAYFYDPTNIYSDDLNIYSELGFYNTNKDIGHFTKNSRVDYNNSSVYADSIYFERNKKFASATKNIRIIDTINENVTRGNYAEIYRAKDSMFITNKAIIAFKQEVDSLYIHSDTIVITGKENKRVVRAYYDAKIFKKNISGRADSIHYNKFLGLAKFINLNKKNDLSFSTKKKPIIFNYENQITGDTIHLIFNKQNNIDSLKVLNNAFILQKDSLGDGFNQISGKILLGKFKDSQLSNININKNAESIYYLRNDEKELVTIDRSKSAKLKIYFLNNDIDKIQKINQIDGRTYPEENFVEKLKILKGFNNRLNEKIKNISELFKKDKEIKNQ